MNRDFPNFADIPLKAPSQNVATLDDWRSMAGDSEEKLV